jgi:BA14K-like protein
MQAYDSTSTRIARRFGSGLVAGLFAGSFLAFAPNAGASPADAARSAVQSHIQSVRDDIYYRTRRTNAAGMSAGVSYCMRRFRSYDPYSMTYVGYDGRRRHCS